MVDKFVILLLGIFLGCNGCNSEDNLTGMDYGLFRNTPVWNLARAVKKDDVEAIKRIVNEEKVNVDYQEPKYGNTLLMLAVVNQQYESTKALLEVGADPNKHDNYNGTSPIIDAAEIENNESDNTLMLKLLLSHGGNPNDEETGPRQEGNTTRKTPLLVACSDVNQSVSPLKKVKILVDAGANVNYKNEYNMTPLRMALINEHYDVALYLIQKNADYRAPISTLHGKSYYIQDELRFNLLPLLSEEYKQKMKLIDFLQQHGIDYWKAPIPEYAINRAKKIYPDSWQEYLKKY